MEKKNILILARPDYCDCLIAYYKLYISSLGNESDYRLFKVNYKENNGSMIPDEICLVDIDREKENLTLFDDFDKLKFIFYAPFFDEIIVEDSFIHTGDLSGWIISYLIYYELGYLSQKISIFHTTRSYTIEEIKKKCDSKNIFQTFSCFLPHDIKESISNDSFSNDIKRSYIKATLIDGLKLNEYVGENARLIFIDDEVGDIDSTIKSLRIEDDTSQKIIISIDKKEEKGLLSSDYLITIFESINDFYKHDSKDNLIVFVDILFKTFNETGLDLLRLFREKIDDLKQSYSSKNVILVTHSSFSNPNIIRAAIESGADIILRKKTDEKQSNNHDLGGSEGERILLYTAFLVFQSNLINFYLDKMEDFEGDELQVRYKLLKKLIQPYQVLPSLKEKYQDILEYMDAKMMSEKFSKTKNRSLISGKMEFDVIRKEIVMKLSLINEKYGKDKKPTGNDDGNSN